MFGFEGTISIGLHMPSGPGSQSILLEPFSIGSRGDNDLVARRNAPWREWWAASHGSLSPRIRLRSDPTRWTRRTSFERSLKRSPPKARDDLRRVLVRDQADRDSIASRLMRYRDQNGQDWADIIDFLTMHPEPGVELQGCSGNSRPGNISRRSRIEGGWR